MLEIVYLDLYSDKVWGFSIFSFCTPPVDIYGRPLLTAQPRPQGFFLRMWEKAPAFTSPFFSGKCTTRMTFRSIVIVRPCLYWCISVIKYFLQTALDRKLPGHSNAESGFYLKTKSTIDRSV